METAPPSLPTCPAHPQAERTPDLQQFRTAEHAKRGQAFIRRESPDAGPDLRKPRWARARARSSGSPSESKSIRSASAASFRFIPLVSLAACIASLVVASTAHALQVPPLRARVNDLARLLPPARAEALEARLAAHEAGTKQQFALLTVPSLEGDSLEDFSIRVGEAWKLGNKGSDLGLILLIVPGDRKMRIEVGYGLEGQIPDAIAARVIREVLQPAFRAGAYADGIDAAFDVLIRAGGGDASERAAPLRERARKSAPLFGPLLLPLILFILFSILFRGGGGGRGGGFRRGRRFHGGFIPPIWGAGGGFGSGGGFGGFGGGGGSGGFSGGGGGFGGGGASGDW